MHILQYAKVKKGPLNMNHVVTDKQQAILDLKTSENGFTFLANGKTEIAAEEGEGLLTLKAPHKTSFIVVKHPDYGQLTWKVPDKKGLRKKKHYSATLQTFSPDKAYKIDKQWVVIEIQPQDAIVTIDSTMTTIHNGKKQFLLPIGEHTYLAESPFHQEEKGTFELTDEARQTVKIALQPIYSYLTVKTPMKDCDILVDGQLIGKTQGTSGHLREGDHHLMILKDSLRYYDAVVNIGWREKKTIVLRPEDLHPIITKRHYSTNTVSSATVGRQTTTQNEPVAERRHLITAPVTITAPDDSTNIWVNRELKGHGSWEGNLEEGFYIISAEKEGIESRSTSLWIDDETPKTINLLPPMGSYGLLNVHSNEIGAEVYVNGKWAGQTPCIVKNLPAGKKCEVRLKKAGFYDTEKIVLVEGNDMAYVKVDLKKKKEKKR